MKIDSLNAENLRNNFAGLTRAKGALHLAGKMIDAIEETQPELVRLREVERRKGLDEEYGRRMREGFDNERSEWAATIARLEAEIVRLASLVDYQAEDVRRMSAPGAIGAASGILGVRP